MNKKTKRIQYIRDAGR